MDLPDLLGPERILCRCEIHSKKRALQTVAELLGAALRAGSDASADGHAADASGAPPAGMAEREADRRAGPDEGGGRGDAQGDPQGDAREPGRDVGHDRGHGRGGRRARRGAAADASHEISDMDILDALIGRERLGSTGLGHGVALPHGRLGAIETPLAALITLNDGVDFEAGDGEPVDLVLGLLVPENCNDEHLLILANLARRFSDAELRDALRGCGSGEELFAHVQRLVAGP